MRTILTITLNPALDLSSAVEVVEPTHKLRCERPLTEPGGGGINVSRVIRELGGHSDMWLWLGGETGRQLAALIGESGFSPEILWHGGETRFSLAMLEHQSGQQFRFTFPGPELDAADIDRLRVALQARIRQGVDYLILSGSVPPGVPDAFYADLIREAQGQGARVVLDASGKALELGVKEKPYLLKLDYYEALALLGRDTLAVDEGPGCARALQAEGAADTVVMTLREQGAAVASAEGCWRMTPPRVKVDSTIGAGDSFLAAMVLALSQDQAVAEAARAGVGAAAAAVMTPGTRMCERATAERCRDETLVERIMLN